MNIWVREDEISRQIEEVLKTLQIKNHEILKQTMDYLINVNQGKAHEFNREVCEFKQEQTIQNELNRLMDLLVDGSFRRIIFT